MAREAGLTYDSQEQKVVLEVFLGLLAEVTKDGGQKRARGEKPPWYKDGSHWPALWRHLDAWQNDEGLDPDSKVSTLVHLAWRCLAIAWIETQGIDRLSRECAQCHVIQSLANFPKGPKTQYFNRGSYCKACHANVELSRRWGVGTRDELLQAQGGRCAICLRKDSEGRHRLAVDHDHTTGAIRGLLCGQCNTGLGFLSTVETLQRAIAYRESAAIAYQELQGKRDPADG